MHLTFTRNNGHYGLLLNHNISYSSTCWLRGIRIVSRNLCPSRNLHRRWSEPEPQRREFYYLKQQRVILFSSGKSGFKQIQEPTKFTGKDVIIFYRWVWVNISFCYCYYYCCNIFIWIVYVQNSSLLFCVCWTSSPTYNLNHCYATTTRHSIPWTEFILPVYSVTFNHLTDWLTIALWPYTEWTLTYAGHCNVVVVGKNNK